MSTFLGGCHGIPEKMMILVTIEKNRFRGWQVVAIRTKMMILVTIDEPADLVITPGHILRKKRWHVELYHFVWKWWWKTTKSSGSIIIFPILAMNGGSAQLWTPCASRPCLCDCTHSGTCCWQAGAWNLSAPHHRHIELESRQEVCSNPANLELVLS